ncbi:MAG: hypothetical protein UW43_C0010G0009 [Candidatus Yanofskybacteria bacterium GW2011_GWA1_44_21]|uniref:Cell division protein FtsL n=2 Tax=Candidatus Yanofskyibacteriota TaxID=1752733 RepID=A0A1F8GZJ3_9BACT|nr:MAG: hypothetical protein UW14_C0012G0009 [Candidatus Yanofskybacteria bacterium GW2011_GWA2_44_10]KKT50212.1 MAG: hypothetical protein UW43_C0010G0009 [Candidatus Yanofskybacteria bacterium GW2011_GWA1_44_21]KKT90327.1 MAG: hypothetical protein UW90_C0003G0051 [Candidatus Yanofskybacteria bacterium GW2011_GWB1_45_11]OGN14506.1 MAG: hypothetical protein A3C01_00255 [Candidatus Yanofskybacteria bacterium RIFCSPHIGHO2_02_FULL_44_36b]OGN30794.1 MAG: hypothetical protein A3I96_03100 [Candidatus 
MPLPDRLTVNNNTLSKSDLAPRVNGIIFINFLLLGIFISLIFGYVVFSNKITADSYQVKILNDRILNLTEDHGALTAHQAELEDESLLADYAQTHNMVEAADISYLFENGDVALRR